MKPAVGQVEVGRGLVRHGPVEHPVEEGDVHVEVLQFAPFTTIPGETHSRCNVPAPTP